MLRRAWCVVVVTALGTACGSSVNVGRERELLLETDRQWSQTTKDIDKFLSYYAADASVYPQGMPIVRGSAAIRDTFTKMTSTPGFSLRWRPTNAMVSGSGDLGYTTGTYEMTVKDSAGTPVVERGKYVEVWKKQSGGQWKVAEDIFNADAPPPAPAPKVAPTPAKKPPAKSKPRRPTSKRRR